MSVVYADPQIIPQNHSLVFFLSFQSILFIFIKHHLSQNTKLVVVVTFKL